jgi:hypothetical protein
MLKERRDCDSYIQYVMIERPQGTALSRKKLIVRRISIHKPAGVLAMGVTVLLSGEVALHI